MKQVVSAVACTRNVPWHGVGELLDGPVTAADAITAAHLDWEVAKVPIYLEPAGRYKIITNKFAVVRTDAATEKDVVALGVVSKSYRILQNAAAFGWFDPIVGRGAAAYHAAGAVGDGENVWILAKLPGEIRVVGDDLSEKYLLLNNSHDGSSSIRVRFLPIRSVGWNSLMMPAKFGTKLREQMTLAAKNLDLIDTSFAAIGAEFAEFAWLSASRYRRSRLDSGGPCQLWRRSLCGRFQTLDYGGRHGPQVASMPKHEIENHLQVAGTRKQC